jgi:hypothetical protein
MIIAPNYLHNLKTNKIMTLREKFLPKMYCFLGSGMLTNSYDEKVAEDNAKQCGQIAEEFAIGFAEFLNDYALNEILDNKSLKELLEIYKKQKGL